MAKETGKPHVNIPKIDNSKTFQNMETIYFQPPGIKKQFYMEIQKIIQAKIDSCELCGEDPDSASWGYQEGVLISCNQAKQLLQLLSKAPEMLEMLQRLITALDEGELSDDTTEIIVPIMAEAEKLIQSRYRDEITLKK